MSLPRFASSSTPASRNTGQDTGPSAPAITLPSPITLSTRLSLTRLPVDPRCTVQWRHYTVRQLGPNGDLSPADLMAVKMAMRALMDESQRKAQQQASGPCELATCLLAEQQPVLWAVQRRASKTFTSPQASTAGLDRKSPIRQIHSLWIFQINAPEQQRVLQDEGDLPSANASATTASSQSSSSSWNSSKADRDLQSAGVACTHGACMLLDIYSSTSGTATDRASSLLPKKDKRGMLRAFLRAMEEFFLTKWVWTRQDESGTYLHQQQSNEPDSQAVSERDEPDKSASPAVPLTAKKEVDDEEEGALGDDETRDVQRNASISIGDVRKTQNPRLQFWAKESDVLHRPIARFGRGVVLFDAPSAPRMLFDNFEPTVPQHMTLRCFLDEKGHIFLETWPRKPPVSRCVSRDDSEGSTLLLAPLASKATFVRYLGALHIDQSGIDRAGEATMLQQQHTALQRMLCVRGVDSSLLVDEWILCTQDGVQHFLWPAQLSLLHEPLHSYVRADQPLLVDSTLYDVAGKARAFVRESLGLKPLDDETWNDERSEPVKEDDEDSENGDSDNETEENDSDPVDADKTVTAELKTTIDQSEQALPQDDIPLEKARPDLQEASRRSSAIAVDAMQGASKDDEMDLWGSFGFGDREEAEMQPMPRSRDGFDDSGFGLVTEDDFSFFDDAAAAFGAFSSEHDGDEDMQDIGDLTLTHVDPSADETVAEKRPGEQVVVQHDGVEHTVALHDEQQHRPYESDLSSGAASTVTTMDPPSLPGFTPGSVSASSPAVGGMSAKTPRTPYSPGQDAADAHIAIEGEHGSMEVHHPHHSHGMFNAASAQIHPLHHSHTSLPQVATSSPQSMPPPTDPRVANMRDRHAWSIRGRRDITSKYELGKFAMPLLQTTRKKQSEEDNQEQSDRAPVFASTLMPSLHRSRLGHRAHRSNSGNTNGVRPLSVTKHSLATTGAGGLLAHKSRLAALRTDDEMSEATHDDTISERSSLMDDDSDDDASMSSDEASDELSGLVKECESYLSASADVLQHDDGEQEGMRSAKVSEELPDEQRFDPADWSGVVEHLIDNPPLRIHASKFSAASYSMDVMSRQDSQHLFVPMSGIDQFVTIEENLCMSSQAAATASQPLSKQTETVLQSLEPCNVLVGCQSSVVSVTPTALTYWDKLGLSGVSGPKHAVAYAMHLGDINESMQGDIMAWFAAMERVFAQSGLGTHVVADNGLLELADIRTRSISQVLASMACDAEQWSDTLESLLSRFVEPLAMGKFVIIYAIGLPHGRSPVWSLALFERDLRRMAAKQVGVAPEMVIVRPGPWEYFSAARAASRAPRYDIRRIAGSVYDSLQVPVQVAYNSEAHLPRLPGASSVAVRCPSFSLLSSSATMASIGLQDDALSSSSSSSASQFALSYNKKVLNVLQHGALLHVAYRIATRPGEVTIVSIIDERAQGYTASAWRRTSTSLQDEVQRIWTFVVQYTHRARTRWHIVLCKSAAMSEPEAVSWSDVLRKQGGIGEAYALDVTVACVEHNRPLAIVLPLLNETSGICRSVGVSELPPTSKTAGRYVDAARSKYAVYPHYRMALGVALEPEGIQDDDDDDDDDSDGEERATAVSLLALRSSLTITVPFCWNSSQAVQPAPVWEGSDVWTEGKDDESLAGHHSTLRSAWPATVPFQLWTHILQIHSTDDTSISASSIESRLTRITKSFQDLELITRERALLYDDETTAHLPWHLAIVRSLSTTAFTAFQQPATAAGAAADKSGTVP